MSDKTLAIIPAREGSKRVPQKNIREVAGKPLIAHTIEQAQQAEEIDHHIVSTDGQEIAEVAEKWGGNIPFMRPPELGTDTSSTAEVLSHALSQMDEEYEYMCSLQVTTPLRRPEDIDGTVQKLKGTKAESAISVSRYMTPPHWAVSEEKSGFLTEYFDTGVLWGDTYTRSQDVPDPLHPNGAVFAATTEAWKKYETFYTSKTAGYQMPAKRSFDIDEPWELDLIRALFKKEEHTDSDI